MQIKFEDEYAVFFQAVNINDRRHRVQWLAMTPPRPEGEGSLEVLPIFHPRFLKRELTSSKKKTQWKMTTRTKASRLNETLQLQLEQYDSLSTWELEPPAVIKVDHDDYMKFHLGAGYTENITTTVALFLTPYKALRQLSATRVKHLGLGDI